MAFSWSGFHTALCAAVYTTWADIKPPLGGGILEVVEQAGRLDFDRLVVSGGQLRTPYAVLDYGKATTADHAITNRAYDVNVTIHRVQKLDSSGFGAAAIRSSLEALQDYLDTTGLSDGSAVWEVSELDWSAEHPANARFLDADLPWIAGSLVVACLVGETS
jgi:hypothetical protein